MSVAERAFTRIAADVVVAPCQYAAAFKATTTAAFIAMVTPAPCEAGKYVPKSLDDNEQLEVVANCCLKGEGNPIQGFWGKPRLDNLTNSTDEPAAADLLSWHRNKIFIGQ